MTVNDKNKNSSKIRNIIIATSFSFTICILCVSVFQFLPGWAQGELVSAAEVVRAVWVSLAICLCMSLWGSACFSEKIMLKASKLVRYILFAIGGYVIITAWVFASGWCPMSGFGLFTLICIAALVFAGIITFVSSAIEDKHLNEKLDSYKAR